MPTVSVLTATHNRAAQLPRAIDSVLEQTYTDFEYLILDDGSTDDTAQVVAGYNDDRIKYIQFEKNHGPAVVWNRGLELARGDYISFLDSDDKYLPERLEKTTGTLVTQPSHVAGVFHAYRKVQENGRKKLIPAPQGEISLENAAREHIVGGTSCTIYRAAALTHVGGFDEQLESMIDYDLQLRVLKEFSLLGISDVLCLYYTTVDGIQDNPAKVRRGLELFIEKHENILTEKNLAQRHRRLVSVCEELGEMGDATRHRAKSRIYEGIHLLKSPVGENARECFTEGLEIAPPDLKNQLHRKIGQAYLTTGNRRKATKHLLASILPPLS